MTQDQFAVLVAGVATAVTFVQVVPQVVRLLRLKRTEGASPAWAAIGMVINIGWMAYVIAEEFWVTIPAILAAVISFAVVLYLLWRNGADVRLAVISGIAVGVACVVLQRVAGWNDLGTVLGLSNGLYLGPSVYAAWRMYAPSRGPADVSAHRSRACCGAFYVRGGGPDHGYAARSCSRRSSPATVDSPGPDSG